MGRCDVSRVSGIGDGLSERGKEDVEGDGDRTTEGIRPCLPVLVDPASGSSFIETSPPASFPTALLGSGVAGAGAVQSHSKLGFNMRFTVSPSFTGYSFNSFPSASAFPRSKRRCASAGGAPGCVARIALMDDMVSV